MNQTTIDEYVSRGNTEPSYDNITDIRHGHDIPEREEDDWSDEEISFTAHSSISDRRGIAETEDGREWKLSAKTQRCNNYWGVRVSPPWMGYGYIEAKSVRHHWNPDESLFVYAVPGIKNRPMVVVTEHLTTGAKTVGHRLLYAGPYVGGERPYDHEYPWMPENANGVKPAEGL